MNMVEALKQQIERNRELLALYKSLPPANGTFGAIMIENGIKIAETALLSDDAVAIIRAYKELEKNE